MGKHWLLISHSFNMDGRASSITVTDKVPYILKRNIQLTVISAVTGLLDTRIEHHQLLPWGPSALRFDFRHWLSNKCGRGNFYKIATFSLTIVLAPFIFLEKFLIGLSSQASWSLPAAIRGISLVRKKKIDLIYTSAGVWSALLAGWLIKKATGVMWIVEIHDPLVFRYSEVDDGISLRKNRESRFMQKLERMVCRDADCLWWFTQGALEYAKLRNPILGEKGFVVLPGAEPPDCYEPLINHVYSSKLNFAHFGTLAKDRSLVPVLKALDVLFKESPIARSKIFINVYGTSIDASSKEAVDILGMHSNVIEHGRFPRADVVKLTRSADILLALHGTGEWAVECIPSKIYDYFWSDRPILGVVDRSEQLRLLLEERNAYLCQTSQQESINKIVKEIWDDWCNKNLRRQTYMPISPENAVEQICKKINEIS
jgi:glycosyltransferase involved in cell wall biosynthesis